MKFKLSQLVELWRNLNGETAYRRYLQHWQGQHAEQGSQPLSPKEFFTSEIKRKWNGVRRCC